jgi:hypothetical protein
MIPSVPFVLGPFRMLLSHRDGFLFVHIAKTGGTSIRAALRQGQWRDSTAWATWLGSRLSELTGHCSGTKIPRHAPAVVCREMLPPHVYQRLYRFAFVRNPWDRLVSAYSHFQRERQDILTAHRLADFPRFVQFILEADLDTVTRGTLIQAIQRPQLESVVGLRGELIVNFVGRYERLDSDFADVCQRLHLNHVRLPHKRRSDRPRDYRTHYDDQLAERVASHYADDLAAFGYQFSSEKLATSELDVSFKARVHARVRPAAWLATASSQERVG